MLEYRIKDNVVLIDEQDYDFVSSHTWHIMRSGGKYCEYDFVYAQRNDDGKLMHRLLLDVDDPDMHVHHWDGNTLNNRRSNLIAVTPAQHHMLGTIRVCVDWYPRYSKYRARFRGKHLGYFDTKQEAEDAYFNARDKWFRMIFGGDARVFING